jgi:hypothetical protein
MIELLKNDPLCINCNTKMQFSCEEMDKPGYVHRVFECSKCWGTQTYTMPEQPFGLGGDRRHANDRRSGIDTRTEAEKQLMGERRARIARRSEERRASEQPIEQPSNDQLSLFSKRVRRAMREDRSRTFFGVISGEGDFNGHADVLRTLDWIECLARGSNLTRTT